MLPIPYISESDPTIFWYRIPNATQVDFTQEPHHGTKQHRFPSKASCWNDEMFPGVASGAITYPSLTNHVQAIKTNPAVGGKLVMTEGLMMVEY